MIDVSHIRKSYDGVTVLDDISFTVAAGENISILGPGTSGKSTLLKIILGLEKPDSGAAQIFGLDMSNSSETEKQGILKRVGVAFQQGALFDFMTVEQNLEFCIENMTELNTLQSKETITSLLEGVKLGGTKKLYPHELSGGMQRRIGIARALVNTPDLAFFDEPTSGLDPVTSTIILNMIRNMAGGAQNKSMVILTSSVEIAIRFCQRMVLIKDGRVEADGNWKDILMHGSTWAKHFLSARLIGLDIDYARELDLPEGFINEHWKSQSDGPQA